MTAKKHIHEKRGLSFAEYGALLGTREMLRLGAVEDTYECKLPDDKAHTFNMNVPMIKEGCGTVGCIGGHMALIMGYSNSEADNYVTNSQYSRPIGKLFYPDSLENWEGITPDMGVAAIDNFLKDGNPRWTDVAEEFGFDGRPRDEDD